MNRYLSSLTIVGILCLISAISGISSFASSNQNYTVTHYHSYLPRGCALLIGCGLLILAWAIRRKLIIAWRLMFLVQVASWIGMVVGGSILTAKQYPHQSARGTLLFAAMLAIVSAPVAIFWGYKWYQQKEYFNGQLNHNSDSQKDS